MSVDLSLETLWPCGECCTVGSLCGSYYPEKIVGMWRDDYFLNVFTTVSGWFELYRYCVTVRQLPTFLASYLRSVLVRAVYRLALGCRAASSAANIY